MNIWAEEQKRIDACADCKRLGSGLIIYTEEPPARPPAPRGGELLFISEAPPPQGGFWAAPPLKDALRKNLFSILIAEGVPLPDSCVKECLDKFIAQGLFLIQTVKWPLCESARTLRPAERKLIDHSVDTHLAPELAKIRPSAIVAMDG